MIRSISTRVELDQRVEVVFTEILHASGGGPWWWTDERRGLRTTLRARRPIPFKRMGRGTEPQKLSWDPRRQISTRVKVSQGGNTDSGFAGGLGNLSKASRNARGSKTDAQASRIENVSTRVEEARYTDESTPGKTSKLPFIEVILHASGGGPRENGRGARRRPQTLSERQSHAAQAVWPGDGYRKNRRGSPKKAATLDYDLAEGLVSLESELQHSRGNTRTRKRPVSQEFSRKRLHASGGGP